MTLFLLRVQISLLAICFVFSSVSVHGHGIHKHDHSKPTYGVDLEILDDESKLAIGHDAIEGDEHDRFVDRWVENLRFHKKAIEAYRVNSQFETLSGRDVIIDGLSIFAVSHAIEMASGPLLVNYGLANNWDPMYIWAAGIGGGIISVPGLDPLCYLLIGLYMGSKKFRKAVGSIRFLMVAPLDYADKKTGFSKLYDKAFDYQSAIGELTKEISFTQAWYDNDNKRSTYLFSFGLSAQDSIDLQLSSRDFGFSLVGLELPEAIKTYGLDKKRLKKWLGKFGWNTQNFVLKTIEHFEKSNDIPARTYIKNLIQQDQKLMIELHENAVFKKPIKKLKCLSSFG